MAGDTVRCGRRKEYDRRLPQRRAVSYRRDEGAGIGSRRIGKGRTNRGNRKESRCGCAGGRNHSKNILYRGNAGKDSGRTGNGSSDKG